MGRHSKAAWQKAKVSPQEDIKLQSQYFEDTVNSRVYFKSFVNEDEEFGLGDFVMVKVDHGKEDQLWPAEILHIWEEDGESMAEVRWCYTRDALKNHIATPKRVSLKVLSLSKTVLRDLNIKMSSEQLQEQREVFLSDEVDDCPIESISYRIKVVHPARFAHALYEDDDDTNEEGYNMSQQHHSGDEDEEGDEDEDDDGGDNEEESEEEEESDGIPRYEDLIYFCVRQYFGGNNKRLIDINVDDGLHWRNALEFSKHDYVTNAETISIEDGGSFPMQGEDNWFGAGMLASPFAGNNTQKKRVKSDDVGDRSAKHRKEDEDPFTTAIARLQLAAVPKKLPCREVERVQLYKLLHAAIKDGNGCSPVVYMSGMPGTGKTATMRQVASELQAESHANRLEPFKFIELNGMRFRQPEDMYTELWFSLSGRRLGTGKAAQELDKWTRKAKNKQQNPLVVLMVDELDYLLTPKQDILYNLFDWPTRPGSRLLVVGIANTMDLPERLGDKINSRATHVPINFKSYTRPQVEEIIKSRLKELVNVFDTSSITIAAAKVSAYSGDIRLALQICSRAAELRKSKIQLNKERLACGEKETILPALVCKSDVMHVFKQLNESTHVEALHTVSSCQVFVLVALGAEIRSNGHVSAPLENVYRRMRTLYVRVTDEDMKEEYCGGIDVMLTLAETMEIVETLSSMQIIKLTSSRGMLFDTSHRTMMNRLPHLELCVQDTFLSETLGKKHAIARQFFPAIEFE